MRSKSKADIIEKAEYRALSLGFIAKKAMSAYCLKSQSIIARDVYTWLVEYYGVEKAKESLDSLKHKESR